MNVKRGSQCLGNALFDVTDYKVQDGDRVVGIATRYDLDGSRFGSRWGKEIFFSPHPSRPTLRVQPTSYTVDTVAFFAGCKEAGI
jgi:hypothetical protein